MIKPANAAFHDMDINSSLRDIQRLLEAGILSPDGMKSPFFRPCVTQILIELSDVLQKASAAKSRVDFKDHVYDGGKSWDITDLIANCRNAACHISSSKHLFEGGKFTFNMVRGYSPAAFCINNTVMGCEFADDVAIFWGPMRLLIGRNLIRAYSQAKALFPDPWSR